MHITIDPASGGCRVHVWSDGNNKVLFWSQVYDDLATAKHAIRILQTQAATAKVTDRT